MTNTRSFWKSKIKERAHPNDLDDLYVRSNTSGNFSASGSGGGMIATTTGNMSYLVPMRVVTSTKEVIGPQAVNHLNQFTSVTFNFNLLPNVAIATPPSSSRMHSRKVIPIIRPCRVSFREKHSCSSSCSVLCPCCCSPRVFVMYVILGILYEATGASNHCFIPSDRPRSSGRVGHIVSLSTQVLSLYSVIGLFLLLGIVKKNGIMVVDFALQRIDAGRPTGTTRYHAAVKKALKFIRDEQEPDGSWFGRWGVNYIYGTMQVLRGLEAMEVDYHEPYVRRLREWLRMVQNPDGGWGEIAVLTTTPIPKALDPARRRKPHGPSWDCWPPMYTRSDCVVRGIAFLLRTQKKDGSWTSSISPAPVFLVCFT